ncbi:threonine synthase [Halobacteroides halobius DSM 5150]|uniref:Threonine synthase n=1 Tax=Halobacteroides halobius (strain ATCC 35273 / DSM 5150 / MD-1) TaxID=748449 RepID=L0KBU9_HALHC|nr:threonine synthase [Halobacteroides halobius]AGB42025.1 threonine synthase [Halobacteroides halobius DSM 5150]
MKYISTRGNYKQVSAAEVIQLGMVPTGGLFVPQQIPTFSEEEIYGMKDNTYQEIACQVLKEFLTDYTADEIEEVVNAAYNQDNFTVEEITPVVKLDEQYILELWHGPTAAFKDMALQIMPYLLAKAIEKVELEEEVVILVATSGDTGKAALEGFKDVDGIEIIVFYPDEGVSKVQERQMITTKGDNTAVVAVEGNFDDCQSTVKEIFADQEFKELLETEGYQFSSANSINWGRLLPQIIYYFVAYANLLSNNELEEEDKINISVPTGNFGNILAAYYAYQMGLPVNQFICASNDNNVLTDFLKTGVYDINRSFKQTISPSMDILISSNLERFLFEVTGHDAAKVNKWYQQLQDEGKFKVDQETKAEIKQVFSGYYATEEETLETINQVFKRYNYTLDTHTAVGVKSYQKYKADTNDQTSTIIASTANPYKFSKAVLQALEGENKLKDEFEILAKLKEVSGLKIHQGLKDLDQQEVRHNRKSSSEGIKAEVKDILEIE